MRGIRVEVHVSTSGERSDYPILVALDWEGQSLIFKGGPEGERLVLVTETLSEFDMDVAGKAIIEDWSLHPIGAPLVGTRLIGATILESRGVEIGAQLRFERADIEILNNGDQLWIASQLSAALLDDALPRLILPN